MKPFHLLLLALAAGPAQAQAPAEPVKPAARAAAGRQPLALGQVLEVDKAEKRVLVKHGPIRSLGMDPMTMEFAVPDPKLLAALKPGDRIRFAAVYQDGDYVITRAEPAKGRGAPASKAP